MCGLEGEDANVVRPHGARLVELAAHAVGAVGSIGWHGARSGDALRDCGIEAVVTRRLEQGGLGE